MMELNLLCLFRKLFISNVFLACLRDLGKPVTASQERRKYEKLTFIPVETVPISDALQNQIRCKTELFSIN